MKQLFIILLLLGLTVPCAALDLKELFNPSVYRELRDSLRSLEHDSDFASDARDALAHLPAVDTVLRKSIDVLPSTRLRIDVILLPVIPTQQDSVELAKRLHPKKIAAIAYESWHPAIDQISREYPSMRIFPIGDSLFAHLAERLASVPVGRYLAIRELIVKLQCELALAELGSSLKKAQKERGGMRQTNGILIMRAMYHEKHMEKLFRVFSMQTSTSRW